MNIGNIQQNTNAQQNINVQQVSGNNAPEQAQGSANASVAELTAGETISGKVLQTDGDVVKLLLNDESVLEAKLANDMQLQAGQLVRFAVKSTGRDGVALMPLFTNTTDMSTASKALASAGLSQNSQNLQMVADMMREGMPIGKDSLLHISKQLVANPDANVTDIVQMNRMGIPVTETNLEQFANYKEYEHQINEATDYILSLVPETFEELLSQGQEEEAVKLYKDILSLAVGENISENPLSVDTSLNADELLQSAERMQMDPELVDLLREVFSGKGEGEAVAKLQEALEGDLPAEQKQLLRDALSLAGQPVLVQSESEKQNNNVIVIKEAELEEPKVAPKEVSKEAPKEALKEAPDVKLSKADRLVELLKSVSGEASETKDSSSAKILSNRTVVQESHVNLPFHPSFEKAGLTKEDVNTLLNLLKQSGAPPEMTDALEKGKLSARDILKFVKELNSSDKSISFLKEQGVQKLAKSELSGQWKITPEQASSKAEVQDLYNRINEQTKQLMDTLHAAAKGDSPIANAVTNLQNNVDFMNQLNHIFPYVQLPLKMSGSDAHGDLYVYTNKKNLAKDDGTVSALLHLDMEHLGPMNVFVKLSQGNHVSTNFYLADEAALNLVAAHMDELTERLQKRGYHMEAKIALNEEKINVMDEMIKQDRAITPISSTAFDARA